MKKSLAFAMSFVCLCASVLFLGCGDNYTYDDLKQNYQNMLTTYSGEFFENNEFKISYETELENLISNAEDNSNLAKLSSDYSNKNAIFEPALKASIESFKFYLGLELNIADIPQDKINLLNTNFKEYLASLKQFYNSKKRLETIAKTGGDVESWTQNYIDNFCETISKSNNFAKNYLEIYKEYLLKTSQAENMATSSEIQFAFVSKLYQFSSINEKFVLSLYNVKDVTQLDNFSAKYLKVYAEVQSILKSSKFIGILSEADSQQKTEVMQAYFALEKYDELFLSNLNSCYSVTEKFSLENLVSETSEREKTAEEKASINKLNEFLKTDCNVILEYLTNLKSKIILWY